MNFAKMNPKILSLVLIFLLPNVKMNPNNLIVFQRPIHYTDHEIDTNFIQLSLYYWEWNINCYSDIINIGTNNNKKKRLFLKIFVEQLTKNFLYWAL